ncbi:cob(I)yrinic acid a,c-diamide adenosyltransferase [archaeon]|nr:cob(I)yrinic acid a,c-diamide adenosyltransferase [archaeon]
MSVANMNNLGLIHIYTGEGKGKTTAAIGLAIRAIGRNLNVKIIQLFKRNTGEQFFFSELRIPYLQFQPLHPFFKKYSENELDSLKKEFLEFWEEAIEDLNKYDLVIIDEFGPGMNWKIIDKELATNFIKNKPKNTELILTGRGFPKDILNLSDYVTEMKQIKHPYEKGIFARKAIEF